MPNPPQVTRELEHVGLHASTNEALLSRLDDVAKLLGDHGLAITGGSRFDRYRRLLSTPNPVGTATHQAFLECEQLCLIVSELARDPAPRGWREKVRAVLSGTLLPAQENAASSVRNLQFELFAAAIARRAGYQVELAEPDVRLTAPDHPPFVLAAKRLRSPAKVRRNVRKASKQIVTAGGLGVIALDVTPLVIPPHRPIQAGDLKAASAEAARLVDSFRDECVGSIRSYCDLDWVIGLQLVFAGLALVSDEPQLSMVWLVRIVNLCDHDDPHCDLLASYAQSVAASPPIAPTIKL